MVLPVAFVPKPLLLPIDRILPSKVWPKEVLQTRKYKQILASIKEIDVIEPLSIAAVDRKTGQHMLLDGHLRLMALQELAQQEAPCLVASDDEAYTYNNCVNRLSTVQEHYMILRALKRGVTQERLAKVLCVEPEQIRKKAGLLKGICLEAADLLKDRQFSVDVSSSLRRMKPTRQVECAELMVSANKVTVSYVRALLMATPVELLVAARKPLLDKHCTQEQVNRMEREMGSLQAQYKLAEQSYSEDTLNLVLARGYINKLIENPHVMRYLRKHHEEVLEQFESIVQSTTTVDA